MYIIKLQKNFSLPKYFTAKMFLPRLSIMLIWFSVLCIAQQSNQEIASNFRVGVILDLDSLVGRIGLSCLSLALSDFYSAHPKYSTRLILHVRDSKGQVIEAASSGTHFFSMPFLLSIPGIVLG